MKTYSDIPEIVIGKLLTSHRYTISVAESCTGGRIMDKLTNIPGSSGYFMGGVVAYSNEAKIRLLGVDESTLREHGAVSYAVAVEMARGVKGRFLTDIGVSTTGIAGPTGGTPTKPVGLVYIGLSTPDFDTAYEVRFDGGRWLIKEHAGIVAIQKVIEYLSTK